MTNRPPCTSAAADARLQAARIIRRWMDTGRFPEPDLDRLPGRRALTAELVYGVLRWRRLLETVCGWLVPRPPPPAVGAVLWIGAYQLLRMDRIPDHAAVHATVEAAKQLAGEPAGRLVNAVLRRMIRQQSSLEERIRALPMDRRWSHPPCLVDRWSQHYPPGALERLCAWNNRRPSVCLRVCASRSPIAALQAACADRGIETVRHAYAPDRFLVLPRGIAVADVPGYQAGAFVVQDPSTDLAIRLLDLQPGQTVLDLCAAPGGKTAAIADAVGDGGRVCAVDRHPDRVALLENTLQRLRFRSVSVYSADATDPGRLRSAGLPVDLVDRALVDAPCSNTGVLARRPDARWRFDPDRLARFAHLQAALLTTAAGWVRPAGVLVYSTCSLEPEENEALVAAWTAEHPAFALQQQTRLFPPEHGTDGAFAACWVRNV